MKTDIQLKQDIEAELMWDPKVNATQIGVSVDEGAVTLFGAVDTFPQKWAAEAAAKRVDSVRTVAQELTVKLHADHKRSDSEIAKAVLTALTWDVSVPKTVTAKVVDGQVTLEGKVAWHYERDAAVRAVQQIMGVSAVFNDISLKPVETTDHIRAAVEAALYRQAATDASSIHIDAVDGKVTLTGTASSWQMMADAANAAWAAPGVVEVIDHLKLARTTL